MAGVSEWSWPIPFVVPPCPRPAVCATVTRCRDVPGSHGRLLEPASPVRCYSESNARFSSPIALGGYRPWGCQVAEKRPSIGAKRRTMPAQMRPPKARQPSLLEAQSAPRRPRSGAGAAFNGAVGTIGVDVERASGPFDHLARDHDLLDALQPRQIEHGFKQDAFENRAKSTRPGFALDRLAGDRAKSLIGKRQLDVLHLE